MINLNLLDESEIPKDVESISKPIMNFGSSEFKKWMMIGTGISAFFYICILGYYFLGIKGPLGDLRDQVTRSERELNQLVPKVEEANKASEELDKVNKVFGEFDRFVSTKKNWAKVFNILSNELPDEIIFSRMELSENTFDKKTRSESGLITVKIPCDVLKVDMEVPEEYQGKISEYVKKLKKDQWMDKILLEIKTGGLVLQKKSYHTSLEFYFPTVLEDLAK